MEQKPVKTIDCRIFWYRQEFMISSCVLTCTDQVLWPLNQTQINKSPSVCSTIDMRCLCWYPVFVFCQMRYCALWPNPAFGHLSKRLVFCVDATFQTKLRYHVLFRKRFSLGKPDKQAIFVQSFSNITVMNLNI